MNKYGFIIKATALAFILTLSACGGGGGDDASPAASAQSTQDNSPAASVQSTQDISTLVPYIQAVGTDTQDTASSSTDAASTAIGSSSQDAATTVASSNQLEANNDPHDVITPAGSGISLSNGINSTTCYIHQHYHFSPGIPDSLVNDIDFYHGNLEDFELPSNLKLIAKEYVVKSPGDIWYNGYSNTVYTRNLVEGSCAEYKRYLEPPSNGRGVVSTPIALGIASIVGIATRIGMVTAVASINPSLAPVAGRISACAGGAAAGVTVNLLTGDYSLVNNAASAIAFCVAGYGGASATKYLVSAFTPIGAGIVGEADSIGLSGMRFTIDQLEHFAGF